MAEYIESYLHAADPETQRRAALRRRVAGECVVLEEQHLSLGHGMFRSSVGFSGNPQMQVHVEMPPDQVKSRKGRKCEFPHFQIPQNGGLWDKSPDQVKRPVWAGCTLFVPRAGCTLFVQISGFGSGTVVGKLIIYCKSAQLSGGSVRSTLGFTVSAERPVTTQPSIIPRHVVGVR